MTSQKIKKLLSTSHYQNNEKARQTGRKYSQLHKPSKRCLFRIHTYIHRLTTR